MREKIFGFKKNIFFLGTISFFNDMSSDMIAPLLPLFLKNVLGAPYAFIGLIEGVAESSSSIFKLIFGWMSDCFKHRKPFVVAGYSVATICRPFIALAIHPWQILIIRFTDRFGKGIRSAPRDALIADSVDPAERGRAFGFQRAMDHFGAVIGPLIASALLYLFLNDYRKVFWFSLIPGIIAVILAMLIKEPDKLSKISNKKLNLSLKPFDLRFKYFITIAFIFTLGNSSDAFLLLRAQNMGVATIVIPILWAVHHIIKSVSSTPAGIVADKLGKKKVIITGWLIYGATYLGFAFASKTYQLWLLFILYGLFFGLNEGTERAFVADLVPSELRGSAFGLYNFSLGIGFLPASIILGLLWQKFGPSFAFSFGAGLALLAAILLALFVKEKRYQN